jgi:alpha-galactosidase
MIPTKIVFIGAASAAFGPTVITDTCGRQDIAGATLVLVDIDEPALEVMTAWARIVNESYGSPLRIESTTDRKEALPDAQFVIVSIAIQRNELWKLDWEIPLKHGIKQVLGENGGPGGLSHSLRNIPLMLDIAKDMERLCPDALMMIFSNPENRLTMAVERYTSIKAVGLCPGWGDYIVSRATNVPMDDIILMNAGLNHFAWILDMRRKNTGEDLYPLFRKAAKEADPEILPLSRHLFERYGYFPRPSDDHIGEYISYAWEFCGLHGYDFDAADQVREERWAEILAIVNGEKAIDITPSDQAASHGIGEQSRPAMSIISGIANGRPTYIPSMNVINDGLIDNLPDWAVVEVPGVAGPDELRGVKVGPLPHGIAALCRTQVGVQDLCVEAAVKGSRELALQAMLADPVVQSAEAGEKCLDELLQVHAPYLPQFSG